MLSRNNYQEKIRKMENKKYCSIFRAVFFMKREISNKGSML